jgi:putative phosphoesterase
MRIAFLSDAHGNYPALARCLAAVAALSVDACYFLGDAVGYLPGECEVIRILTKAGIPCQLGNHEAMLLGRIAALNGNESIYGHTAAAARLGRQNLEVLQTWPLTRELECDGRRILLIHGRPSNPLEGYCYPDSDLMDFEGLPYDVVAIGHTHRPFVRRAGRVLAINAGSCGLPRDQGDSPSFAIYDTSSDTANICRVRLDVNEVLTAFGKDMIPDVVVQCFARTSRAIIGEYTQI